jgi:streptogramin lyase
VCSLVVSVGLLGLSSLPAWAAAGTVTEFPVPGGDPLSITAGPDGNLWFTAGTSNIGRITTAGKITEFPVSSEPFGITAGPDGNLWFTLIADNAIGRITPSGSFTSGFGIPTANSRPEGITVGPDGNVCVESRKVVPICFWKVS